MRIFLAPMEGVIDHHFRKLYSAIGGIDVFVSEFLRVNDVPVSKKVFLRDCPELQQASHTNQRLSATPDGTPLRVQLLGSNPETIAASAVTAVNLGASAIDLNFGCPAKTVNKSRGGAVLLKDPQLVGEIVRQVRVAVPNERPVTAKIRLGYEDRSLYMDNALAIAEAGATELCVHARSRADGYNPPAYWSYIKKIIEAVSLPVIANGEVWSVNDWRNCREQTGCEDVMLGRGLIACPDLALQIKAAAAGKEYQTLSWSAVMQLLNQFYYETKAAYPSRFLGNRVKQWLFYLQMHYPEAKALFDTIKRYRKQQEFEAVLCLPPA